MWRFADVRSFLLWVMRAMAALAVTACATGVAPDTVPPGNRGFAGVIAAEEPRAAEIGREVLRAGGNAADAAAATGLALAVTLPGRAGLGGGGRCAVYETATAKAELVEFVSADADPAPMLARGLAALQARYGARPWATAVAPAEALARFGFAVSKTLADDLATHGGALMADQAALAAFMDRRRQFAAAGTELRLPGVAEALARLRLQGAAAGGAAAPSWRAAGSRPAGGYLRRGADDAADAATPAATAFVVGDSRGLAVACVLSMGAPFGRGTMAADGYLRAAPQTSGALRPLIVTDAAFGQAVLLAAAFGAGAEAMLDIAVDGWLDDGQDYDRVRARLQDAGGGGVRGNAALALCAGGLALVGAQCRTLSDVRGRGLGLTFAAEERR